MDNREIRKRTAKALAQLHKGTGEHISLKMLTKVILKPMEDNNVQYTNHYFLAFNAALVPFNMLKECGCKIMPNERAHQFAKHFDPNYPEFLCV